jgi:hypothetical protein
MERRSDATSRTEMHEIRSCICDGDCIADQTPPRARRSRERAERKTDDHTGREKDREIEANAAMRGQRDTEKQ